MIVKAKPKFVDFDAFLYEKVEEADELIRFVRGAIHEAHEVQEDGTVVLRKGSPSELEVRLGDVVYYNDNYEQWDAVSQAEFLISYSYDVNGKTVSRVPLVYK